MGDRGNIVFYGNGETAPIYFYTHWGREDLPKTLQSGLLRGWSRWGDDSYLARILFSELIGSCVFDLTGFGISTTLADGDLTCVVRCNEQTVTIGDKTWSFSAYVQDNIGTYSDEYGKQNSRIRELIE